MKSFLLAHAALLALPIYALGVWLGWPLTGAVAGLAYAVGWSALRHRGKRPPVFEIAAIVGLAVVAVAQALGVTALMTASTALLLLALGLARRSAWRSAGPGPPNFPPANIRARRPRRCSRPST